MGIPGTSRGEGRDDTDSLKDGVTEVSLLILEVSETLVTDSAATCVLNGLNLALDVPHGLKLISSTSTLQ